MWQTAAGDRLGDVLLVNALKGKHGLDVGGLREVHAIGFDLDFGHKPRRGRVEDEGPRWEIGDPVPAPERRDYRNRDPHPGEVRAARALRRAFPDVDWLPVSSPRGVHLHALLAEVLTPEQSARLGEIVLERAGLKGHPVEVFPKLEGSTSRTCRLPLTGRSRLLSKGLTRLLYARRADDLRHFVSAKRATLAVFGLTLRDLAE